MMKQEKEIMSFTDAAVNHINGIMARRGSGIGFRIAIKTTGCNGFMYQPEIVEEACGDDIHFVTPQGLAIYIDSACADIVRGTVVDYVKKDLGQYQLLFDNPNVESECGCGESFNLKEETDK